MLTVSTFSPQAVNSIGAGPFSCVARLCTRPLPPAPPKLECVNVNYNSLKLKWGDSKVSSTAASVVSSAAEMVQYTLEMEKARNQ